MNESNYVTQVTHMNESFHTCDMSHSYVAPLGPECHKREIYMNESFIEASRQIENDSFCRDASTNDSFIEIVTGAEGVIRRGVTAK